MVSVGIRGKFTLNSLKIGGLTISKKGFGEDDMDADATSQDKLEEWLSQFGAINAVRKRRGDDEDKGLRGKGKGKFKVSNFWLVRCADLTQGSCFVEFAYEADIKKFVEIKEVPKFTPDGPEMLVMTK
jgi:lupus La protein